ncbi:MAG: PepSY domain-containing protein, partial [Bacteroidota bacterium]
MTISIWRYSHLVLALSSALFLVVASVTGVILAFEPMVDASQPFATSQLSEVNLSEAVTALQDANSEVFSLEVDANDFVLASVITHEGNSLQAYVDPRSAEVLGAPSRKSAVFEFATNLHRSLFLKTTGRLLVGIFTVLLVLITVSGFLLLIKRQGGIGRLFSRVPKEGFSAYYHVTLSKWLVAPIVLVAVTGIYLSAEKFSLLPEAAVTHADAQVVEESASGARNLHTFEAIPLSSLEKVEFPFSPDPQDFFLVKLHDRELMVHQYTGEVISEAVYPVVKLLSDVSLTVHTGRGSVLWSIVLLLTSSSVLFFLFSGVAIFIDRKKQGRYRLPVAGNQDTCEFILLVGSETGTTFRFASALCEALVNAGKTALIAEMNAYTAYPGAKHLVVLAATYGNGEPTTNARKFTRTFSTVLPAKPLSYSVVGFGSTDYPHFCAFATQVDAMLGQADQFAEATPLHTVNKRNTNAFLRWAEAWRQEVDVALDLSTVRQRLQPEVLHTFQVVARSPINNDDTFLLQLRPKEDVAFRSGDLLCVQFDAHEEERLYSIGRSGQDILLSVKKHAQGKCSTYLAGLSANDTLEARVRTNPSFHFPAR